MYASTAFPAYHCVHSWYVHAPLSCFQVGGETVRDSFEEAEVQEVVAPKLMETKDEDEDEDNEPLVQKELRRHSGARGVKNITFPRGDPWVDSKASSTLSGEFIVCRKANSAKKVYAEILEADCSGGKRMVKVQYAATHSTPLPPHAHIDWCWPFAGKVPGRLDRA